MGGIYSVKEPKPQMKQTNECWNSNCNTEWYLIGRLLSKSLPFSQVTMTPSLLSLMGVLCVEMAHQNKDDFFLPKGFHVPLIIYFLCTWGCAYDWAFLVWFCWVLLWKWNKIIWFEFRIGTKARFAHEQIFFLGKFCY